MTPALQLLLECARRRPDGRAICALANSCVDWQAFIAAAETHDLKSLSFWRLQQFCPTAVPPKIFADLHRQFRRNTDRNLFMTGELFRIVQVLDRGGIPAAAFKGPVFAWSIYETPAVREYMDLDILVRPRDVHRARHLLQDLGYRSEAEMEFLKTRGQLELVRDAPEVALDIHWDLAPRSMGLSLDAGALWPHLTHVAVAGRQILSFDPADQLMLSALHGGKHGWTTLAWLADIDAMVATYDVDWDRVLARAAANRLSRALFLGLQLSHDLLRTPVPAQVMRPSTSLAREAKSYLIDGPAGQPFIPRKVMYQLRLTEGRLRQCRLLWRSVTRPNLADSESLTIRPSFFWLYYAARPCRLAIKYVKRLAARFKTNSMSS